MQVSLARAAYQGAHVFIFDDPLSAVDAHVGQHIFSKLIGPKGMLRDACRILVTHAIQYLPECDHVVCIRDNTIQEQGSYSALIASSGPFAQFVNDYLAAADNDSVSEAGEASGSPQSPRALAAPTSPVVPQTPPSYQIIDPTKPSGAKSKVPAGVGGANQVNGESAPLLGQQLIKTETTEKGEVKRSIYKKVSMGYSL